MEYCKDQNGTIMYIIARPQSRGRNQNRKEHIFHTGSSSNYESILENEWFTGRRIESQKHKTSLFLLSSESARTVIATANDRLEKTR